MLNRALLIGSCLLSIHCDSAGISSLEALPAHDSPGRSPDPRGLKRASLEAPAPGASSPAARLEASRQGVDLARLEAVLPPVASSPAPLASPGTRSSIGPSTTPDQTDSDYDGVSDTDEREAGTNPHDSADAPAWHPELTTYPRTIFGPEDKADVQARFALTTEPFPTLASRIRSSCSRSVAMYDDPDGLDQSAMYYNANIARNCAFLGYLEGTQSYKDKAIGILLEFPSDLGDLSQELFDNTDIHVAEALSSASQAYDLLRGATALDDANRQAIESNLMGLAESCYHFYAEQFPFWYKYQSNNHKSKMAAAMGLAGMTINQDERAARFVSYAATELTFIFDWQTTPDGGYGEGTYYLSYATETVMPFFIAHNRYSSGQTLSYTQHCDTRYRFTDCREEDVMIDDFLVDPDIRRLYEWWVEIMMPDGMAPNYDDANLSATFNGVLAGVFDDGIFRAAWERNKTFPYFTVNCQDLTVETLVFFPYNKQAVWPSFTSAFNAPAGTAVFRSGWQEDARYLLLLAEHDDMLAKGHEQPDGTSIMMAGYGERFIIDAGYGSWSQSKELSDPEDHSLVLVDGDGPRGSFYAYENGSQVELENCRVESGLERCDARTVFNDTTQVRTVYFVEGQSFAVVDRMEPGDGDTHDYTSLWQLNAGGDTGGTFSSSSVGGQITRTKGGLTLGLASSRGTPTLETATSTYAPEYGVLAEHLTLSATVSTVTGALLGVMEPRAAGSALPTASRVASSNGVAALTMTSGSVVTLWLVTDPGISTTLSSSSTGLPEVVTDADFVWIRFENGVATKVHYEGATVLKVGGTSWL